ncbi:MAG TPA: hypothetical protein VND93_33960, partial [Myxococcales bacterium]|nr:hypothetical protein [Myxococcales bacterium]
MAESDEAKAAYAAARRGAAGARTTAIRANEVVKGLRRDAEALARQANQSSGEDAAAALREVQERLKEAEGVAREAAARQSAARAALLEAHVRYAAFSDPTVAVGRMPDDVPFALFPLRLEARYRTLPGRAGEPQRWLWVRAFPDDALVDTFQPEIAKSELENVTTYWTHVWRAGGDPAGRRAAWAALVKTCGAGRARWLTRQVAPLNPTQEPVASPGDHVLVIRPPSPVPAAEQEPIARFWERVWSTSGAELDD